MPDGWRANNEMVYPGSAARPKAPGCWLEGLPVLADGAVAVVWLEEVEHADKIRTSAAAIQQSEVVKLVLTLMTGNLALFISFPTFSKYAIGTEVVCLRRDYCNAVKRLLSTGKISSDGLEKSFLFGERTFRGHRLRLATFIATKRLLRRELSRLLT